MMKLFESAGGAQSIDWLEIGKSALTNYVDGIDDDPDITTERVAVVSFLLEQLDLLTMTPNQRRYSLSTVRHAYVLHATSASAYETLRDIGILILPHRSTLHRITAKSVDGDMTTVNTEYLTRRFQKLNSYEIYVELIFDEIYIKQVCYYFRFLCIFMYVY